MIKTTTLITPITLIPLDCAPATNRNQTKVKGVMAHVADGQNTVDRIDLLWTIPGHSKCPVDQMLALLNRVSDMDLFCSEDIKAAFSKHFPDCTVYTHTHIYIYIYRYSNSLG